MSYMYALHTRHVTTYGLLDPYILYNSTLAINERVKQLA